jgi:uncharacterized lipoprotein NlpE involved in copper resistance
MKKKLTVAVAILLSITIMSCGSKKETPASVAQKWCDLNAKAHKASDADKAAAEKTREKFEKDMETKYKDDKDFMKEVEKEVEKCEDASEGR